jgi:hypothetical protein
VNLDDLIIVWFCLIDGVLPLAVGNKHLRTSEPYLIWRFLKQCLTMIM